MMAMIHAMYPPTGTAKLVQAFMSPELPKRSEAAKEVASIVYGDRDGYHSVILLEVEDAKLAEYVARQVERSVFLETRVEGLRVEYQYGHSVMDAISVASRLAAK
jgi:hypothetical protein